MGTIKTYVAYHATDKSNANAIIEDNFLYHPSDVHWLGDGVYFFLDKELAFRWGYFCPTKKYGKISVPAVIEALIRVDDDELFDMRKLESFNEAMFRFDEFWNYVRGYYIDTNPDRDFYDRLECAFFNWLTSKLNLKCIICEFDKRRISFAQTDSSHVFNKLRLSYMETQMCVKDVSLIIDRKEIIERSV